MSWMILISGDAYVDHPAFGTAVIGRIMESEGLRVAIVPQPNWQDDLRDFKRWGNPACSLASPPAAWTPWSTTTTAGAAQAIHRRLYPRGEAGFRPDYATTVYTKILKELYPTCRC